MAKWDLSEAADLQLYSARTAKGMDLCGTGHIGNYFSLYLFMQNRNSWVKCTNIKGNQSDC